MSFGENDLGVFFSDFAIDANWNGTEVKVIYHNAYEGVTLFGSDIESKNPFVEVRDSDIEGMVQRDIMGIDGTDYYVIGIQPDGTGITVLILSKD